MSVAMDTSTAATTTAATTTTTSTPSTDDSLVKCQYDLADLPELLKQYYKRLFPCKLYHKWLTYGGVAKNYFENREFSFTLKDDIYIRYLSFADSSELMAELVRKVPYKIDIGAVYNYKPKDHKTVQAGAFKPLEKELVFDIDMTDYDEVRVCCSGAAVCTKCWGLMSTAIKVLDKALAEDFNFKHRLWVFSGRRGIHCWVCDDAARKLTQSGRSAVAEYLNVVKGGEGQMKKVNFRGVNLHPSLQRASSVVSKYFREHYMSDQELFEKEEQRKTLLNLIQDESLREKVEAAWKKLDKPTSAELFGEIERYISGKFTDKHLVNEIMFQYVYPRLDINVSKGLNHLLKSPFCIHPKTGRVCVPIDPSKADEFDPTTAITIYELLEELDFAKSQDGETNTTAGEGSTPTQRKDEFMLTSLKESIVVFQNFLRGLDEENKENRKRANDENARKGEW